MQYSFSPCPLLSKLSDLGMYLIAAVSAVMEKVGKISSTIFVSYFNLLPYLT
jgi:hypothetical protein